MEILLDYRGVPPPKASAGIPLITAKIVKNGRLLAPGEYIAVDDYGAWMRRGLPNPGDVVITTEAPLGEVAQIPEYKVALGQRTITLRGKQGVLDNDYLKYALQDEYIQNQLRSRSTGTTVLGISQSELRKILIPIPHFSEQRAIAAVLSALDNKIALNCRMNDTLEAIARAIFRSWFVDFDPVRAKIEGRDHPGIPKRLIQHFPNSLEDLVLGDIPKGWNVETVGKHMINFDSQRVPVSGSERAKRQGTYPYHGAAAVMDYVDDYLFDGIYVLVGEDGSVVQNNGMAVTQYVWGKLWVNNHAHVLQGKGAVSTEQLYLYFCFEPVRPYVTGAVQPKLSQGRMNAMPFVFAGEKICCAFGEMVQPLFAKWRSNADMNKSLAVLRDALLPKLISGELRMKGPEPNVEGVA